MGLWIAGEFTEEEKNFIENHTLRCVWTSVFNFKPGDPDYEEDEDNNVGVYYEKGEEALYNLTRVLNIFEKNKAQRVNQIGNENHNFNKSMFEEFYDGYFLSLEEMQEIYDLIKETPKMYYELSDGMEIYADKKAMIEVVDPSLIEYNENGTLVWSDSCLGGQIEQVIKFYQLGLKLQRLIKVTV